MVIFSLLDVKSFIEIAMADGKRLLQLIALFCTVVWMTMICHKGYHDISMIIREYPDDWGKEVGKYLLENWAGGKDDGRL